mmetsp:Transcript_6673/g.8718  ORF Transcript_6673/g.8718 Transcript_6673/m.8718 type:complete len:351 (-) Transcript_6673:1609-2661(-)
MEIEARKKYFSIYLRCFTPIVIIFLLGMNYFYIKSQKCNALKEDTFVPPVIHFTDSHHNSTRKALMCAIVKDEEAYIHEWVDYHYALGFDKIRIYDNSDFNEMKVFGDKKENRVDVIHFPGVPVANCDLQERAYHDCAQKAVEEGVYTWAAFFDIDEFLVLKKHEDVHDMLEEYLQKGALGINWYKFEATQSDVVYVPLPVTKRFTYRNRKLQRIIKSIVKLSDFDLQKTKGCYVHYFPLKEGVTHGFNGEKIADGMWHGNGTEDVAVLHHYHAKSFKEYLTKRLRGRAGHDPNSTLVKGGIRHAQGMFKNALRVYDHNSTEMREDFIFDDSAWQVLKKNVPRYAAFDAL